MSTKQNSATHKQQALSKSELSQPLNTREITIKQAVEKEWSIEILKGELNGLTQLVISIQGHIEQTPSYHKYADFMSSRSPKAKKIELELMNRAGLSRSGFTQIQSYIERLRDEGTYKEVEDIACLLASEDVQESINVTISGAQAEMYFDLLVEHIEENIELFPKRIIDVDTDPQQGYIENTSQGVYIADEKGIKKYGCESIAIMPKYLREVFEITHTNTLGAILEYWVRKGYLYFDESSVDRRKDKPVKLRRGIPTKRAYVLTSPRLKRAGE